MTSAPDAANTATITHETHTLSAQGLSLGYGDHPVITGIDLDVLPGKVTGIIGANACGKSTLLKSMSRLLKPSTGSVLLDGRSVHSMPAKQLAQTLGLLPQSPIAPEGITVADLVGRGRHPHQGIMSRWSGADDEAVAFALDTTGTAALADRSVDELSGGQRQRVWIAMALAQQTDILLLDEVTSALDPELVDDVLQVLRDIARDTDITMLIVTHEMQFARDVSQRVMMFDGGVILEEGHPEDIFTNPTQERTRKFLSAVLD